MYEPENSGMYSTCGKYIIEKDIVSKLQTLYKMLYNCQLTAIQIHKLNNCEKSSWQFLIASKKINWGIVQKDHLAGILEMPAL